MKDRQVWANRIDRAPTATEIAVYTVCYSVCVFWTLFSMVKPHCAYSNFLGYLLRHSTSLMIMGALIFV